MGKRILTGAVDIGGTKIQVGIVDDQGELLDEKSFPTDCGKRSAAEAMDKIWQILKEQCGRESSGESGFPVRDRWIRRRERLKIHIRSAAGLAFRQQSIFRPSPAWRRGWKMMPTAL